MKKSLHKIIKESINNVLIRESQEGMIVVTKSFIEDRYYDRWQIIAEEPTKLILSHIETENEGGELQVVIEVDNIKARITDVIGQFYDLEETVLDDIKDLLNNIAELDDSQI